MKRICALFLIVTMIVTTTACSQQAGPAETPASAQTEAQNTPTETPTPSPSPTPEPKPFVPMDIFDSEFNPYGMEMPDNYTVFEASFNKGSTKPGAKDQFVLSMTGSGNMFACVAYLADVAGLSEDEKNNRINEYLNGRFTEFEGKDGYIVTVRQANPNDDRYEYVTADGSHGQAGGCVIDITFFINDADVEKYTKLVSDNYNLEALAALSDYMDVETDFSECGFGVNLYKQQAASYVVYYPSDAATIQKSMESGLSEGWWEWNGMKQTSIQYGALDSKLTFDTKANAITIEQTNNNFKSLASEQAESEVSLTKFGFGFDDAGTCGVFELREPHYMSVAIHRPEWGEWDGDWNIEYMDEINGYSLRITYFADEGRYNAYLQKGGEECAFDYYPASDEKGWEHPDLDTAHRMFNDAFGTKGKEMYYAPLAYFEQLTQERFGMSVDELYALPIR